MILHNTGGTDVVLSDVGSTVKVGGTYDFSRRLQQFSGSADTEAALTAATLLLEKTLVPLTFYTAERAVKKLHRAAIRDEDGVIKSLDNKPNPAIDDLVAIESKADNHKLMKTQAKNIPRIYGSAYQYAESNPVTPTTSALFTEKKRLSAAGLIAGDYRIGFQWEWCRQDATKCEIQCQLDDGAPLLADTDYEGPASSQNLWQLSSGFVVVPLTSGTHTVDIDFRKAVSGGAEFKIRKARIEIWRTI